jgi:hypothetical protein
VGLLRDSNDIIHSYNIECACFRRGANGTQGYVSLFKRNHRKSMMHLVLSRDQDSKSCSS